MDVLIKPKPIHNNNFHSSFINLMKDENIQLPLRELEGEDYIQSLERHFDYYCSQLTFISDKQLHVIKDMICPQIINIVKEDQFKAYEDFQRLMKIHLLKDKLHIINDQLPIDGYGRTKVNLFRLRQVPHNKNYRKQDIFHQPKNIYTDKHRAPYRYSLEDYPSLYLGTTIYSCDKELGSPLSRVIGSVFKINPDHQQNLYILNIGNRPIDYVKNKNKKENIFYSENDYLFVYPLIAACSFVDPDENARNILEYKLSNLLFRWFINENKDKVCGIRYFSCYDASYQITDKHDKVLLETKSTHSFTKYFINYVFSTSDDIDCDGYCNKLKNVFSVSMPKFVHEYGGIREFETGIKNI